MVDVSQIALSSAFIQQFPGIWPNRSSRKSIIFLIYLFLLDSNILSVNREKEKNTDQREQDIPFSVPCIFTCEMDGGSHELTSRIPADVTTVCFEICQ